GRRAQCGADRRIVDRGFSLTMCRLQLITVMGLALAAPVPASPPAAVASPGASATTASLPKVRQQLKRNQGELERQVARQESDSKQAGERLQRQDKQIEELRRKLLELQASHPAGQR